MATRKGQAAAKARPKSASKARPNAAAKKSAARVKKAAARKPLVTLAVDIGGTGVKSMLLDESGNPVSERLRDDTPRPAEPLPIVEIIVAQAAKHGAFNRVSVGFPGVVHDGVVATAPNLDSSWAGVDLAATLSERLKRPTRVLNDADVQGFGAIAGKGVELVVTLGTGLGSALFVDGRLVPNLELAHHAFHDGKTYEECVGAKALKKLGKKAWNKQVRKAIAQLDHAINYHALFIGGGNAKKLEGDLPPRTSTVSNACGLLGGIALWRN